MEDYHYKKEYGTYYWYIGGRMQHGTHGMAIGCTYLPDEGDWLLLKHGGTDNVKGWYLRSIEKYNATGLLEEAMNLRFIECNEIPVEELNKIIQITGYLGLYIKKMKIVEEKGNG